ncbi:MAG: Bacillolysin precursor (Neutral protease), partial [uncultured Chloroflexia bacterium]
VPAGWPAPYFSPSPDKMTSLNYSDDGSDSGGVHTNSGVNNKAAYLIVDGGTLNGKTITSLGVGSTVAAKRIDALSKAGKLYYDVEDLLLTSGSDYQDLYDYLYQGCVSLIGTRAKSTTGALSTPFTAANCVEVREATQAVEMDKQPLYVASPEAAICDGVLVPTDLWVDDMETTTSGNWVMTPATGDNRWSLSNNNANSGTYSYWAPDAAMTTDLSIAQTRNVVLPTTTQLGTKKAYLHFNHWYGFEGGWNAYDGGTVEYAVVSGTTVGPWSRMDALPAVNGFNATVSSSFGNPIGGRRAFGFQSYGYQSSRFDITSLAGTTAKSLRFRFRIGTDSSTGHDGWEIDDVRVYTCGTKPANPVAPNLLQNRSFEYQWDNNTFADGWGPSDKLTRSTSVPQIRRTGLFSGRLSDWTKNAFSVEQKVAVTAGTTYTFTGYYMIPTNASDVFSFAPQVVWMNSAGTPLGAAVPLMTTRTTHTGSVWTAISKTGLIAPTGATRAAVRLVSTNLGNAAQTAPGTLIYVDDFYFGQ